MPINNKMKATSTILAKFQTTIPTSVRDRFDLREGDLLEWQFDAGSGALIVRPMRADLLPPKGIETIRRAWEAHKKGETTPISAADFDSEHGPHAVKQKVTD